MDEEERPQAAAALRELGEKVREIIKEEAAPEPSAVVDLEELADLLPDVDPPESLPGDRDSGAERNLEGNAVIELQPIKVPPSLPFEFDDEGEGGDEGNTGGGGQGGGTGNGGTGDNSGKSKYRRVEIRNARVLNSEDDQKVSVSFTAMKGGDIKVRLRIAGDHDAEPLEIKEVLSGGTKETIKGKTSINACVEEGERKTVSVVLAESIDGLAVSIDAFAETKGQREEA